MANLAHLTPQFGFRPAAVNHSPSPLGFGFGLSSSATHAGSSWQPPQPTQSSAFLTSQAFNPSFLAQQKAAQKRRHEDTDDDRDESMDRSPTPERRPIRRIAQKRFRMTESQAQEGGEQGKTNKENKTPGSETGDDVDVGMLLASLPPQSLLPILTSLISADPSLKSTILSLIPRPTLGMALNALNQAAKKLRDAYPYSTSTSSVSPQSVSTSFGFGSSTFGASRANIAASSASPQSNFGRSPSCSHASGMRDAYVQSRLRPHISEYVSTVFSYLPYFSYSAESASSQTSTSGKEKAVAHPTETFEYLSLITNHIIAQPSLAQALLAPLLLPRLLQEWMAWVNRVDQYVNREAGMFGMEVAQNWARSLDNFAGAKFHGANADMEQGLKSVRDRWVATAGWLVGRRETHSMEEEEEL